VTNPQRLAELPDFFNKCFDGPSQANLSDEFGEARYVGLGQA
jgi:hypothetical protein